MRIRQYVVGGLLVFLCGRAAAVGPEDAAVVVCNTNMAGAVELASHYVERRGIPADRICNLDLPITETMTRSDYDRRLREPLLAWLRESGLIAQNPLEGKPGQWQTTSASVRYLVSIHGVPLRIADTEVVIGLKAGSRLAGTSPVYDRAAVDSELALLLLPEYSLKAVVENPLFGETLLPRPEEMKQVLLLIAGRLDGPGVDTVRRMIDQSVEQERYGLLGLACFDLRSTQERGYVMGDLWLQEAYERMAREGYECYVDREPGTVPIQTPIEDVAFYLGWYTEHADGPFRMTSFQFAPGAIAYHLHSEAASTVRSESRQWAGPLLAKGAAATMGAVYEPYLAYTPNLDRFTHHLCNGHSFGESLLLSQKALSWQVAVVGDPLYRPFRYGLDQQIVHLEADGHPGVAWAYVRKVNLLLRQGRFQAAVQLGREKAAALTSPVLWEKVGDILVLNGAVAEASEAYAAALALERTPVIDIRLTAKSARIRRSTGDVEGADAMMEDLHRRRPGHRCLGWASDLQRTSEKKP